MASLKHSANDLTNNQYVRIYKPQSDRYMNKKFKYSKVHGSMQRVIMKMKINHLSIQSTFYKRGVKI